ncbi:Mediator of DNA damage checkpoint protein 1, partial [Dissostichus eleginoides]
MAHLQSHQRSLVKYGANYVGGGPSNHNDSSSDGPSSDGPDGRSSDGSDGRSSDGSDGRSSDGSDGRSSDGSGCCSNMAQYFHSPQHFD